MGNAKNLFSIFESRVTISDFQFSILQFIIFSVRVSSFDVQSSVSEFRSSMRAKQVWHRKLFDFVVFILSVDLQYMLEFVYLHHLACQIHSIYTSSPTPTATSTRAFYFYIAACDDQSSWPHCYSTSILLLVTTVPPARAWY